MRLHSDVTIGIIEAEGAHSLEIVRIGFAKPSLVRNPLP
jgi:hypothetical protein